ncbi:MAG: NUDIX domain-containing protein [Gemmatales bacterium]|nr:NUDIX domain-containing protein [Gemmatales bacterium]MDW8387483.1 NUDIX domain-containing protein [Gemmatales bacterium]
MKNPGDELVEVVDDLGRVVAIVTRREMRQRRLPHRCTWALVFNSHGELFIHQRSATKDLLPLHWDVTVGGVLAVGEDFEAGVRRELLEELGIRGDPEALFPFRFPEERPYALGMVYRLIHDGPFAFRDGEIVQGEFVALPDLANRITSMPFCEEGLAILRRYQSGG